ncbi:MAG: TIGR01459 family HAD-type hydrolase [Alphaproteobacteria bacterium]|jgi:HAD superfamily hydrolase (TIGR01459 family)|nr:TIGR01459 family HAD-type hydrolase [Alphaproteobacteria bacterium]
MMNYQLNRFPESIAMTHSMSETINDYDVYILDLWGVLYDGGGLYPGVLECLTKLKQASKIICLLSNAPRLATDIEADLKKNGLTRDHFDHIMTSGQFTHDFLQSEERQTYFPGDRFYFIGADRHVSLFSSLPLTQVEHPKDADFVLTCGTRDFSHSLTDYQDELALCASYNLPMICANPDKYVMNAGKRVICAGLLAQHYSTLKQRVQYFGKPYTIIYDAIHEFFPDIERDRMLMVGDSFETDVKGGFHADIDVALISGGVHSEDLKIDWGQMPEEGLVIGLCEKYDLWPRYVLPTFTW